MTGPEAQNGLFQRFRPDGEGVESVFVSFAEPTAFLSRLQKVYRATVHPNWARDAYFVVRHPFGATEKELEDFGVLFIERLRHLSGIIAGQELSRYLNSVQNVRIVAGPLELESTDEHLLVWETVGDWLSDREDPDHPLWSLREAYYTIACDYWLKYYLTWPFFEQWCKLDVFEPYFRLWERGTRCVFSDGVLVVGDRGEQLA